MVKMVGFCEAHVSLWVIQNLVQESILYHYLRGSFLLKF